MAHPRTFRFGVQISLFGVSPEEALQSPHSWMGPVGAICDDLHARRERWDMSYVVVLAAAAPVVAKLAGT